MIKIRNTSTILRKLKWWPGKSHTRSEGGLFLKERILTLRVFIVKFVQIVKGIQLPRRLQI